MRQKKRHSSREERNRRERNISNNQETGKKRRKRRGRRKNLISKTLGMILAILQFILSVILVVNILFFDMLTTTYVMVLVGALMILLGITLLSQIGSKGKGIPGKIFAVFVCAVLVAGSFFLSEVNNAFNEVTGSNTKISAIEVAVLKDDPAEVIQDAEGYTFGVCYSGDEKHIRSTIVKIEEEIGEDIELIEYDSVIDEARALIDGDVEAIIYKASQTSMIEEQMETFCDDTRVIFEHNIVIEIENEVVDASVAEPFAVYLSGIDVYGDIAQESRSDVNIVAVVNPVSHQILLITTPRDYYVPIPNISRGQNDKLTHAGIYGVDASMATLSELYDIDIPFYGRVNFTSMINIVDALGGLEVYSDAEFTTSRNSGIVIHVEEGWNKFNGEEALAFCRERKNLPDGDNARGRHQQAVITAIIQKMMSPAMLRGAMDILASVSEGIDTNFSTEQIQALIKTQLRTGAEWYIYSVSAEGTSAMRTCYSAGALELSVCIPNSTSVANIQNMIALVEAGELIDGSTGTSGTVIGADSSDDNASEDAESAE